MTRNFQLNHHISPGRHSVETLKLMPKSLLCRAMKGTPGVDYFSLVEVKNIGLCRLLVQTNVQKSGHKEKIEKFMLTPFQCLSELPVIHLYLNPNYQNYVSEGAGYSRNILEKPCTKHVSWYFSQATESSMYDVLGKYALTKSLIGFD